MSENFIDRLLDPNDCDPIALFNERGEEIAFEQIAVIPIRKNTYFIMRPIQPLEGLGEDEGLVFSIGKQADGQEALFLVENEAVIDAVFKIYDEMVAEANE